MELLVETSGTVRTIYSEQLDVRCLGKISIRRGSHVEPTASGQWTADLAPVGGPVLGPFDHRSEALAAEVAWLQTHWLTREGGNGAS
jgi:hypothetical protein